MQGPQHAPGSARGFAMPKRVRAVLGPTNTGKTHYALERMLAHASGIIGFPLRLLARENYDRMVAIKGAGAVALITGEEKIVPDGARWFSCTVEAMPLDLQAEFVAVDEIQLCADPDRGHVFTDRLLHARGLVETLFLGAETIRPIMMRLVPGVEIETRPRLSGLLDAGPIKLSKLPARSAIVAFSAAEVYAIAEVIRRRRGGCAVIMGQLSPRTRNAQVALYQNKEVDYLVATDAIGMGLNMDVGHVALAGLSKFDGTSPRPLLPQEVAQIAGRAGRGMRDGTFGTTGDCPPMSPSLIEAIETHRFDPIARLSWRNSALDFSGPMPLLESLLRPPAMPGLTAGRVASDLATLDALVQDAEIVEAARGRSRTQLLWDVCQIPDFRKLGDDSHLRLCARLFFTLRRHGAIPPTWFEGQLGALDRVDGDIDTLMHRLSGVRVCTYVAARTEWSRDAAHWQARARAVEDTLSDALHERLTTRFVDRRATSLLRRLDDDGDRRLLSAVTKDGDVVVEGHAIGRMVGFALHPDATLSGPEQKHVLKAGKQALKHEMPRRVQALVTAEEEAFAVDWQRLQVAWLGVPVARLVKGRGLLAPAVRILPGEFLHAGQRDQVAVRLQDVVSKRVTDALAALLRACAAIRSNGTLRGLAHRLEEDGGVTALTAADTALPKPARDTLRRHGISVGSQAVFCQAALKPEAMRVRAALFRIWRGDTSAPATSLVPERVSVPSTADEPDAERLGWVAAGPIWLRLDVAERITVTLAHLTRKGARPAPDVLASWFGVASADVPAVLRGLGIAHTAAQLPKRTDKPFGPPAPLMLLSVRRSGARGVSRRNRHRPATPRRTPGEPSGAFAALARWREATPP
ncbi:helicase-related protein [Tanticharoenia sakaeratensis]|uniref:ATP-dependent DNA helicase n=1 Tax=Tanticharoenia sakaeratensis NBRC 103193 TaxID=1231623 RepID=A0A0D6MJT5_9PROT|nr:helicase-related protein [Tanticharoenia sakaeratensis]GAN53882.1 ATP-dependent DNA helicase [Tanticharoenia sakaeratensis NBRC 103193]GBQ25164.1 DNA helicase [Tanticharoenia sakaeratensis NBRC 103193]